MNPKHVREFAVVMRALSIVYVVVGLLFLLFPDQLLQAINSGSRALRLFEEAPMPTERFWLALTVSMMMMLSLCAHLASCNPEEKGFTHLHLLSKTVSTVAFLIFLFAHRPFFAYAVGAAVDGTLALFVLFLFRRMQRGVT